MQVKAAKIDSANLKVEATIPKSEIEERIERSAKKLSKQIDIPGFRKGKVPVAVVKQRYGQKLEQEAKSELIQEAIEKGFQEAGVAREEMLGEPVFKKYDEGDAGIEMEVAVGLRPKIDLEGYEELIPEVEEPQVSEEEVQKRIEELAEASARFVESGREEAKEGDLVTIDFKGSLEDGSPIEGGSAENFELRLGSGQFIPGFEEQVAGMKKGETKTIEVTFPEDYPNKELAGKPAKFEVTLKEIKEKEKITIDDEFAKKVMPGVEDATLEKLKAEVKKQLENEKLAKLYNEELKPKLMEALVERYDFDLPANIVEQEVDVQLNNRAASMSKEEIEELRQDREKLEKLKKEIEPEAKKSVKATFIVNELAQREGVEVKDDEVIQAIYYEALQMGRDPKEVLQAYQQQGLLPAVKMAMIEDRLLTHLLEKKRKKEAA